MTDTVTLTLTATFSGDAPTSAEKHALFLRFIYSSVEALAEHEINLKIDENASAPVKDASSAPIKTARTRGGKLTAEQVREIAESPDGWVKAAGVAGYSAAGIRGAAARFGIDLPGVRRRSS